MLWALLIILLAAVILKKVWYGLETLEGFGEGADRSDNQEVSEGASSLFNWGLPKQETEDDSESGGNVPQWNHWKPDVPVSPPKPEKKCQEVTDMDCRDMGKCPITLHPDITKYVLKSSIPPCPDMNDYVLKSEMPPNVNLDKYILKSEIPPCPRCPNLRDYIKKSEIPSCPPRVKCPVCPVCPRCPSDGDNGGGDVPVNMDKYMLKTECRRLLREQARGNRQALRIQNRDEQKEIRQIERDYDNSGENGDNNAPAAANDDGGSGGGFFNTLKNDIQGLFGNGASVSSGGSYSANGDYSGLTTQGLAVGDVYKRA
jgi:hypothetical protein